MMRNLIVQYNDITEISFEMAYLAMKVGAIEELCASMVAMNFELHNIGPL